MKTTHLLLISALTLANTAQAANWRTPAEAMQLAAMDQPASADDAATLTRQPEFFQITSDDVSNAVVAQMQAQGFDQKVDATVTPATPVIYSADHPLKVAIHALQIDTDAKIWQAQAYILADGKTETVKPVAGRYDTAMTVPVLKRPLSKGDIIAVEDIELKTLPERQLRKDTITATADLIGHSPSRGVSANRPLRTAEIGQPVLIKKGQLVEMHYTTPYMNIRTSGEALEDGAKDALIRVKNTKSEKAISARVVASGKVEVNTESL